MSERALRARDPGLTFDAADIPRHWFGGSAFATHLANGVNLLFPAGERFFVRSVRRHLDQIEDPALREQVKGFFGQEGRHAQAHERFFEVLEAQGYAIRPFLAAYERVAYGVIEPRVPAALCLSVTVALEHFTAMLAENALETRLLARAHPSIEKLLLWHAAEEIEHKAVAFDVLKAVNPSYALRMAGLALASTGLLVFWVAAAAMLLKKDGLLGSRRTMSERRAIRALGGGPERVFVRGIRAYVRRGFHPDDRDTSRLAAAYLEGAGLA